MLYDRFVIGNADDNFRPENPMAQIVLDKRITIAATKIHSFSEGSPRPPDIANVSVDLLHDSTIKV